MCLQNSMNLLLFLLLPGNDYPSVLISFATKTLNAGQITSKLHIIELGAQPGELTISNYLFYVPVIKKRLLRMKVPKLLLMLISNWLRLLAW